MKITYDAVRAEAEELMAEERKKYENEEKEYAELVEKEVLETEKRYLVSSYCPVCGREITPEELDEMGYYEQLDDSPYADVHKEKIEGDHNIPMCIAYYEHRGTEIECPECGSSFMENEKTRTVVSTIPITILTILCTAFFGFLAVTLSVGLYTTSSAKQASKNTDYKIEHRLDSDMPDEITDGYESHNAEPNEVMTSILQSLRPIVLFMAAIIAFSGAFKAAKGMMSPGDNSVTGGIVIMLTGLVMMVGILVATSDKFNDAAKSETNAEEYSNVLNTIEDAFAEN